MRKPLLIGLGLGALWRVEEEEDGPVIALSPFPAALPIEAGIFLLRHRQGSLLSREVQGLFWGPDHQPAAMPSLRWSVPAR